MLYRVKFQKNSNGQSKFCSEGPNFFHFNSWSKFFPKKPPLDILMGLRVNISVPNASKNPNRIHCVLVILIKSLDFWTKLQSFFTSVSLQNNVNCSLAQRTVVEAALCECRRLFSSFLVSGLWLWFWRALRLPISLCVVLLCTTISLSHDSPL